MIMLFIVAKNYKLFCNDVQVPLGGVYPIDLEYSMAVYDTDMDSYFRSCEIRGLQLVFPGNSKT